VPALWSAHAHAATKNSQENAHTDGICAARQQINTGNHINHDTYYRKHHPRKSMTSNGAKSASGKRQAGEGKSSTFGPYGITAIDFMGAIGSGKTT